MKALEIKFSNEGEFMVLVELIKDCLVNLRTFVLDHQIDQAWLILEVIDEINRNKILAKILSEPEEYKIRLKKAEVLAIKIMLNNYDVLQAQNPHTMSVLVDLNTRIDEYLINNPVKDKQKCVQLLNSATSESKKLISG